MLNVSHFDTALRIYYGHFEIGNAEITQLFGLSKTSRATVTRLKKEVQQRMSESGIKSLRKGYVDTKLAYEVWGLNVVEMEKGRKKLISLGLYHPA